MAHSTKPEIEQPLTALAEKGPEQGDVTALIDELQKGEEAAENAPRTLLTALSEGMFDYFRIVGAFFLRFLNVGNRHWNNFYRKHLQRHTHKLDMFWLRVKKWFSKLYRGVLFQSYMFLKFFSDALRVVRNGFRSHPEKNGFLRCCYAAGAFGRGLRNNARIFLTALNYLLPAAAVGAFAFLISYVSGLNYALSVDYDGQHIGYVENETVYDQAEAKLQERLLYQDGDEVLNKIPKFEVLVVSPQEKVTAPAEAAHLTDTIIRSSSADMVEATGIKIDGEFLGAVKNMDVIDGQLDRMLNEYRSGADEKVEFTKEIQTETGLYLQKNVLSESSVLATLTSQTAQDVYYTAVAGDSPSGIASMYDMSTDEIVALNPNILTELKIGQQVLVNKSQPYLPVKCVRTETYTVSIPYETVYVDSGELYEGRKETITEGVAGEQAITAEVSYVDGVETERNVLSTVTIAEPVTQKIAKGTKVMPRVATYTGPQSNLGFINPVVSNSPYVSQRFTGQYGHTGIDIAFRGNGYGTPILATLPGTVEYSGWRGTYGNLVIINHGGGLKTYYAHCSKLLVTVGQTVSQGQQIANVGSTGRSTGNHCHFMVVVNGSYKNPFGYIPGY